MPNPNFLEKKYADLPGSKPVERAVRKKLRKGEKGPTAKEERVEAYLDRLEEIIKKPMGWQKEKGERGGFELLKQMILDKYVTKYEEIPESYWQAQEEEMRRRGEAADWAQASEKQREEIKRKTAEAVLTDQRASLEQWVDYFASPDSDHIPRNLKYWVMRSVLGLQELAKKKEGEREYIEFPKRSRGTVKPFPDINYEALAYVVDAMVKNLQGQGIEFEHDIQPAEREEFHKFLNKQDFAKLYGWANELMQPIPEHLLPITEGKWVKYPQNSAPEELVKTIRGRGTGWCTAGLNTARTHLRGGDFYVYYTLSDDGLATMPRIAIRMEGHDKIAEDPRGIAYKQNLDPYMGPTLEEKLKEFGAVGDAYKKKSADMKHLTDLEKKTTLGQPLGKADLVFLYEIDSQIEGFGYQRDPRIAELRSQRNPAEDASIVLDCQPSEIAHSEKEITKNTKAYIGELFPNIFQSNLEHIYTSFPEGKIKFKNIELGSGPQTAKEFSVAIKAEGHEIYGYAEDILKKVKFENIGEKKETELVILIVASLGFREGATRQEIYDRAIELGLKIAPAEVGPELRLQYKREDQPKGEYLLIGMEPIAYSDGDPDVFIVFRHGDGKSWLTASSGRADDHWYPGNQWVFVRRKYFDS